MLFFSLAENTNFSAQSHGIAEGTEFTISLFTIMALTFQGNELGGKEHHWVPRDKAAGLPLRLIIWQGGKLCPWNTEKGLWTLENAWSALVSVSCNRRMAPTGSRLTFPSEHTFLPIMILNMLKSTLGRWQFARESNASGIIPRSGQRGRVNKALLCVANRRLC